MLGGKAGPAVFGVGCGPGPPGGGGVERGGQAGRTGKERQKSC